MRKMLPLTLGLALLASSHVNAIPAASVSAAAPQSQQVTLYSPLKYKHDQSRAYFNFQRGALARGRESWDVGYGTLRVGEYHDWFTASSARGSRSVIRDLGPRTWADALVVPVVEPLPKLKEGEQRRVSIDASGANGRDGAPGKDGAPGRDGTGAVAGAHSPGITGAAEGAPSNNVPASELKYTVPLNLPQSLLRTRRDPGPPTPPREPTVDPMFVKAVVGHMYVIHVVDDQSDYYALFRVESLERGDNCTITWMLAPAPAAAH